MPRLLLTTLLLLCACATERGDVRWMNHIGGDDFDGQATTSDVALHPGGITLVTPIQGTVRLGDVHITGGASITQAVNPQHPYAVVSRFTLDGTLVWAQPAFPGCHDATLGPRVAADASGAFTLADARLQEPYALCFSRYAPNGKLLWSRSLEGAFDVPRLAVTPTGDTLLAGRYAPSFFTPDEQQRILDPLPPDAPDLNVLMRWDPEGTLLWARVVNMRIKSVEADASGHVLVASELTHTTQALGGPTLTLTPQTRPTVLTRLTPDGQHLWSRVLPDQIAHDTDLFLDVDTSGDILLAGYFQQHIQADPLELDAPGRSVFVARFNTQGQTLQLIAVPHLTVIRGLAALSDDVIAIAGEPAYDWLFAAQVRGERHQDTCTQQGVSLLPPDASPTHRLLNNCLADDGFAQPVLDLDALDASETGHLIVAGTVSGHLQTDDHRLATARRESQWSYLVPAYGDPSLDYAWAAFLLQIHAP